MGIDSFLLLCCDFVIKSCMKQRTVLRVSWLEFSKICKKRHLEVAMAGSRAISIEYCHRSLIST